MGYLKNQELEKDENYRMLAESKVWVCDICGYTPSRGEDPETALALHISQHMKLFDDEKD